MKRSSFYKILSLNRKYLGYRIQLLVVFLCDLFRLRHLVVTFDPANTCNLRCTMCYYGNPNYLKRKQAGKFTFSEKIAEIFFPKALSLNIGAAAEPTVYKKLDSIVTFAKQHRVPSVSITTNGQALTAKQISNFVKNDLGELTISVHGVYKASYEKFMVKSQYTKLHNILKLVTEEKIRQNSSTPEIRINFTANVENFRELNDFFSVFGNYDIKTLQIRPVVEIDDAPYEWKSFEPYLDEYNQVLDKLQMACSQKNITLIATRKDPTLKKFTKAQDSNSFVMDYVMRTIKPGQVWKKDFKWTTETYRQYCARKGIRSEMLKAVFGSKQFLVKKYANKPAIYLTYEIHD